MKKLIFLALLASIFFPFEAFSQTTLDINELEAFSASKRAEMQKLKAEAEQFAIQNNIPITFETPDGDYAELQYILDGIPQYYITENVNAAKTISTNQVQPGGSTGLNLSGNGITIHEWDAGEVRVTHQEFGGRVTQGDNPSSTHPHATHVAGTILASGVVTNAKGMAPSATMRAFDWNYDESEMASEAANGALFSNHSYGYSRGWRWNGSDWVWYGNSNISTQEDYLFGFYDSQAQDWDQISYNAPYYLIVKSAGNDRNDGPGTSPPNDGPYDCISHSGIAKNVMTVGAVNDISAGYSQPSNVVMSSFSSWGPADDGRIKPDIVANGVGLYSSLDGSDSQYGSYSGTSMSSPNVTGSLALLQEHYHNLNNGYMRAATLKGLVLSTADEAGTTTGPDYKFGWGLMNTKSAALKISENENLNVIDETVLNDGAVYTRTVYNDGTEPLKVAVCWTDPAGTPVSAQLDPLDPALVNDLDLKVTYNGQTYYPWKLDPLNPATAATNNSENNVDNVEIVLIQSPQAGNYTITVDHDGTLSSGSQAFSIILDGISVQEIPPVADFTSDVTSIYTGESIQFTDNSTNEPSSWSWTFEGGTPATSTEQNPNISYSSEGTFDVELIVTNSFGSDTLTKTAFVTVSIHPPVADFTSDLTQIIMGNSIQFTDQSTFNPTSWSWSFEGGTPATSSAQNPSVTYSNAGTYQVSLTVSNSGGNDTKTVAGYVTVIDENVSYCESYSADFSNEYIERVQIGDLDNPSGGSAYSDFTQQVLFATPGNSYSFTLSPWKSNNGRKESWRMWIDYNFDGDFNDAGELVYSTDNKRNPVNGTLTIPTGISGSTRLRITMEYQSSNIQPCDVISFGEVEDYTITFSEPQPLPPVADFSANTTSLVAGNSVDFSDLSANSPTSWSWTFEGGTPATSTSQNPSVTYNTIGTYNVTLTATNGEGNDTKTITDYITVTEAGSYCSSQSTSNALEWISQVQVNSFSNNSDASFYTDFTTSTINLTAGANANFTLTPGYSGKDQREFWRVWIDLNADGDFDDADETIVALNNKKGTQSTSASIPSYANGQTRMRISMKNGSVSSPCETFGGGEVEDYTVSFNSGNGMTGLEADGFEIQVYPNPVEDILYFDILGVYTDYKLSILDNIGQQVYFTRSSNNSLMINTDKLLPGVYYIRVVSDNKIITKRFVKM